MSRSEEQRDKEFLVNQESLAEIISFERLEEMTIDELLDARQVATNSQNWDNYRNIDSELSNRYRAWEYKQSKT